MGESASALMALATATQTAGSLSTSITQASALRQQGDYQKMMADQNAKLATLAASDATARGETAAQNAARENSQRVGAQRAAMAAQGVDANSGSAAAVQGSQEAIGELNQTTIKNNAWREAWGYKVQGENYTTQGKFAKMAGDNAASNTLLSGGLNAVAGLAKAGYAGKDVDWSDPFTIYDNGGTLYGRSG